MIQLIDQIPVNNHERMHVHTCAGRVVAVDSFQYTCPNFPEFFASNHPKQVVCVWGGG